MSDRVSLLLGAVCAVVGLAMISRLDISVIQHGGLATGLAALDLGVATLVVCAVLGFAARQW